MNEIVNQNQIGQQYKIKLTINGIQVPTKNILSSVLREWIFDHIVTLECNILDSGTFVELSPLFDECPITIEFSKNEDVDVVKMDFVINVWETERLNVDNGSLYAIRFIAFQKTTDYFYPIHFRTYRTQSSSEVLKFLCDESGIDYVGEENSKDNQTWIQSNCCNYVFTDHLMKRCFVRSEDLPLFYFNRNNQAIFSTVNNKALQKVKFLAINNDFAYMDNGNDKVISELKSIIGKDVETLYYRTDTKTKNITSISNKNNGYGIDFTYFDHRNFFDYRLDFTYSPFSKYQNKNKNNSKKYVNGITYNSLSKNVHENYLLAKTQNLYLKESFFSNYLQIVINPNMNINIGDKIEMIVYDNLNRLINGTPAIDVINSGDYLVGGISHDIKKDGLYSMILTLFRNGVNESNIKNIIFDMTESKK